ncbi:MAG: hypothetical protein R3F59_03995 [Myxococcota bacterium]
MMWIGGPVIAMVVLFLAQGLLLQVAVALTGERAPRYGRAMVSWMLAWLLGGVAGMGFEYSIGWVIPAIVGQAVAVLLGLGVAAIVFKRQFRTSLVQGLAVAVVYTVLSWLVGAGTWYLLG